MIWMYIIIIALIIIFAIKDKINDNKQKERYENGMMNDEEKEKYEKILKHKEQLKKAKTIKQTMIVNSSYDSRKKVGSTLIRGAVGSALLGPVGLVGGAMTGKNKISNKTTFIVEYEDGHRETITVDNDSSEFKKLCNYLKM